MKIKLNSTAFILKTIFIITCATVGFAGITQCTAQSIVGKWKAVSVKYFYSEHGAKMMGKSMEEKSAKETGNLDIEYKAGHTFISSYSAGPEVTTMKGTWDLTGDQLKITLEPQYNPKKIAAPSTVSINGNTLVTTIVMPPQGIVIKTISTSTRM